MQTYAPSMRESDVKTDADVVVSVETITPEEATTYLESNFQSNRDKSSTNILRWATDMRQGRWKLSTDCIAFDQSGRLINGQNRLTAVEKAKVPVEFLVARNFPATSVGVLDLGKKRMMHERITIAGVPIKPKECSVIRNAMSRWESRTIGTIFYSQLRHDETVVKVYHQHNFFLKLAEKAGYMSLQIPGFFVVGALMIYAEEIDLANKQRNAANIEPLRRALQFMEIVTTGSLEHTGTFKRDRDGAALHLHHKYHEYKHKRKHWSTWQCFVITMKLAKKFQTQLDAKYVTEDSVICPFVNGNILGYKSTNQQLITDVLDADYLSNKVKNKTIDEISQSNAQ